jgi:hypothetical protein
MLVTVSTVMGYVQISADNSPYYIDGPFAWEGFEPGHGTWTSPDRGFTWVNDQDPTRVFSGVRWCPAGNPRLLNYADLVGSGYSSPPPPPQPVDSDGDGTPDDYDPDPNDPNVY